LQALFLALSTLSDGVYYTDHITYDLKLEEDFTAALPLYPEYMKHIFSYKKLDLGTPEPKWLVRGRELDPEQFIVFETERDLVRALKSGDLMHVEGKKALEKMALIGQRGDVTAEKIKTNSEVLYKELDIIKQSRLRSQGYDTFKYTDDHALVSLDQKHYYLLRLDTVVAVVLPVTRKVGDFTIQRFSFISAPVRYPDYSARQRFQFIYSDGVSVRPISQFSDLSPDILRKFDEQGQMITSLSMNLFPQFFLKAVHYVPNPNLHPEEPTEPEQNTQVDFPDPYRMIPIPSFQTIPYDEDIEIISGDMKHFFWDRYGRELYHDYRDMLARCSLDNLDGIFMCERRFARDNG